MNLEEKTLTQTYHFRGRIINLRVDDVELPDGNTSVREIIEHPGGVCVAALTPDGRLPFVRQYRYAYRENVLELPAGKLEKGEEPFAAAQRELREETGFTAEKWDFLGAIETSPGFLTEKLYLYLARGLTGGTMDLDEGEFLEPVRCPLEEAAAMAADGRLSDAKTLAVLLRAGRLLKGEV